MDTPCIISPLAKDKDGYPRTKWRGKSTPVARVVMILLYGEEAVQGRMVLHHCDNSGCASPLHLYLGDFARNMQDKVDRKRVAGDNHPNVKLTDEQCEEIRQLHAATHMKQREIADLYGVGQVTISAILTGKRRSAS